MTIREIIFRLLMRLLSLFVILCSFLTGCPMTASAKKIYGYVEKATLVDNDLTLSAKLDTGAKSSSLSAINIQEIEKDGKTYIQYTVPYKSGNIQFTSEYVGRVKIKVRVGEIPVPNKKPPPIKRPVVLLKIRLDNQERLIAVNLTNRKRFNYPLLLGREAIKSFGGIIDPSIVFTIKRPSTDPK